MLVYGVVLRFLAIVNLFDLVNGRGHLIDPPMRSSLWRYYPWSQMDVPQNVDDTGLNCGGFWRLHEINKGKCGVCGDPYDQKRHNEAGGKFANGYIVRKYHHDDQYMNVTVDVLSNIGGYFQFYLCPNDNVSTPITQECLDKHPLTIKGYGRKYTPTTAVKHNLLLKIPDRVTCSQCVLQWKWVGGNNWGICPDGYGGLGCGKQEEYYNCADIAILPASGNRTRNPEPDIIQSSSSPITTTSNPLMPILPPFIQRSEKFKRFYKKYIENVMKGMVAGKWSDNAISSLEYKLEKQKRNNQSEQRTFWVPSKPSDFRLTGDYPDWSRPSLSIKVPDYLKQNTAYSFMDVVKRTLKNGESKTGSNQWEGNTGVTGRPVYLPEGAVNVPLPTTNPPTLLTTTQKTVIAKPEEPRAPITNNGPFMDPVYFQFTYNPVITSTQSPIATGSLTMTSTPAPRNQILPFTPTPNWSKTRTNSPLTPIMSTTTTKQAISGSQGSGGVVFPDFDYEQIQNNRIIAQRIPYYLHRSALQTPTDLISTFVNSMMSVFSPASVDYTADIPNYDSVMTDPLYTMYPTNDNSISGADPQFFFNNNNNNMNNNIMNNNMNTNNFGMGMANQGVPLRFSANDIVQTKDNGQLSVFAPKKNSFVSRGLSSGTDVLRSGTRRAVPVVRNKPDIPSRQLSNSDGSPGQGVRDSTVSKLRFSGNMFL